MKRERLVQSAACAREAFTLIELLASLVILGLLVVVLFGVFQQTSKAWQRGESHVETFAQARAALDLMSRELSQAITTATIPFFASEDQDNKKTLGTLTLPRGNLAFIASIGNSALDGSTSDGTDLMEVVYRLSCVLPNGKSEKSMQPPVFFTNTVPPYMLIRRVSGFNWARSRNYGNFTSSTASPWDFYANPVNPDWPETSDRDRTAVVAENVISLRYQFQDASGHWTVDSDLKRPFWNSTSAAGWTHELGDKTTARAVPAANNVLAPASSADMLNHAPALVVITLTLLDSKAAARFSAVSDLNAKMRIFRESRRDFTTSISIPNRQP